jgi:hypothetical protein
VTEANSSRRLQGAVRCRRRRWRVPCACGPALEIRNRRCCCVHAFGPTSPHAM